MRPVLDLRCVLRGFYLPDAVKGAHQRRCYRSPRYVGKPANSLSFQDDRSSRCSALEWQAIRIDHFRSVDATPWQILYGVHINNLEALKETWCFA